MATALRNDDWFAALATATSSLGDDFPIAEEWTGTEPNRYIFREIDFAIDTNGHLQFFFLNPGLARPLPPGGIDEVVDDLLAEPPFPSLPNLLESPATTRFETPLDLNVKDSPAFVIYRLRRVRNMLYIPGIHAITHKDQNDAPRYGRLRHINDQQRTYQPLGDSKLVYFVADPPATPLPPLPPPPYYRHSFNLKVRLIQTPHTNGQMRVLDIPIDPDIRNPDGSPT